MTSFEFWAFFAQLFCLICILVAIGLMVTTIVTMARTARISKDTDRIINRVPCPVCKNKCTRHAAGCKLYKSMHLKDK